MSQTNQDRKPQTFFFAGTDTDVGKTFTAALVAMRLRCGSSGTRKIGVYKPVASGCLREGKEMLAEDAVRLWNAAGRPRTLHEVCPQRFEAALAPTQAAKEEGKTVDAERLRSGAHPWEKDCDVLIVEGAGGLFSPLAEGVLNIDLAKQFEDVNLIVVAANRLGAIHQTLATCAAAESAGLKPAGIILCEVADQPDESIRSNASEISRYTDVPLLGNVPHNAKKENVSFIDDF